MVISVYVSIFILVALAACLANVEMRKSSSKTRESERLIVDERDALERIVANRTEKLIDSEKMRLIELDKNAKFGELAKGLFHDLMNPLSSLAIFIENMTMATSRSEEARSMLEKTVAVSRRMESFMRSIRHTAETEKSPERTADFAKELGIVRDLMAYKSRMAGTRIIVDEFDNFSLKLHPVRLHQLLLNVISNAVDACAVSREKQKNAGDAGCVKVSVSKNNDHFAIAIRDNGCGIPADKIKDAFKQPFTTKTEGTGIGLMTVKRIVEKELNGTISIESDRSKGSVCVITIPS